MAKEIFIREGEAMVILQQDGDFTESGARIVLLHSSKRKIDGVTMYPKEYIVDRAKINADKDEW